MVLILNVFSVSCSLPPTHAFQWRLALVVVNTAQFHLAMLKFRFYAVSNLVRSKSEIRRFVLVRIFDNAPC